MVSLYVKLIEEGLRTLESIKDPNLRKKVEIALKNKQTDLEQR